MTPKQKLQQALRRQEGPYPWIGAALPLRGFTAKP